MHAVSDGVPARHRTQPCTGGGVPRVPTGYGREACWPACWVAQVVYPSRMPAGCLRRAVLSSPPSRQGAVCAEQCRPLLPGRRELSAQSSVVFSSQGSGEHSAQSSAVSSKGSGKHSAQSSAVSPQRSGKHLSAQSSVSSSEEREAPLCAESLSLLRGAGSTSLRRVSSLP